MIELRDEGKFGKSMIVNCLLGEEQSKVRASDGLWSVQRIQQNARVEVLRFTVGQPLPE